MSAASAKQSAFEHVKAVKQAHERELMQKPNVIGVGVGLRQVGGAQTDTLAVVVLVEHKLPGIQIAPKDLIPAEIEGVPVDVQEVGQVRVQ